MKNLLPILLVLLCLSQPAKAQEIYVLSFGTVKKVKPTQSGFASANTVYCNQFGYYSCAIHHDNFYYTSGSELYKATIRNDTLSNCMQVATLPVSMTSMTADPAGKLYFANGNDLYSINPASQTTADFLGTMPYEAAGDLVFYRGELYMASRLGIVKVNLTDPTQSTLHIPLFFGSAVYGMAAISVDCQQTNVYLFSVGGTTTSVIQVDLDNQQLGATVGDLPYLIEDAASNVDDGGPLPVIHSSFQNPTCDQYGKISFVVGPDPSLYRVVHRRDTVSAPFNFTDLPEGMHHFDWLNKFNCIIDSSDVPLKVSQGCDTIYFPTAFTPDYDGLNDVFKGSFNASVRNFELSVYNRWGQLVFTSTDIRKGWDGSLRNVAQPLGTYVWRAVYTTHTGKRKLQKGTVVLIRKEE